jgi:hypothetical protein
VLQLRSDSETDLAQALAIVKGFCADGDERCRESGFRELVTPIESGNSDFQYSLLKILSSTSEIWEENARSPISRTLPGIMTLDGFPRQRNTIPRRSSKPAVIVQSETVMEVTPDFSKAEPAIEVTESGRVRASRQGQ